MSTTSSSNSTWIMSLAESTSTTGTWMVVDKSPLEMSGDLPPPRWSLDQRCSKCCNCGCPVYTEVRHAVFPGACEWCHRRMMHLFRRCKPPSPWPCTDRAEIEWRKDLLRFYRAVIEQRRAQGFQNKMSTPNAEPDRLKPLPTDIKDIDVSKIRFNPQRVQELRELPSWRSEGPVVQPFVCPCMKAVGTDVPSLPFAQLQPISRVEGSSVSGTEASMRERTVNLEYPRGWNDAVIGFKRLARFFSKTIVGRHPRVRSICGRPSRPDPREAVASYMMKRNTRSLDGATGVQHETLCNRERIMRD